MSGFLEELSKFKFIFIDMIKVEKFPDLIKIDNNPAKFINNVAKSVKVPAIIVQKYGDETIKYIVSTGDTGCAHRAIFQNCYWTDLNLQDIYKLLSAYFNYISTLGDYVPPIELYAYNEIIRLTNENKELSETVSGYLDRSWDEAFKSGKY